MPLETSFLLVATNVIAVLILILLLKPALKGQQSKSKLRFSYFIIFLFCMFSFWGTDWFHYLEDYMLYSYFQDYSSTNIEKVYIQLMANYTSDYLQFRAIVWGGALILLFYMVKKLNLNHYLATYFFIIASLIWFSYARVSLAFAIMMLGASLLVSDNSKKNGKFLSGCTLIALSMFFHKSSFFGIGVIAVSYVALFYPKQIIKLSLFLFPVLVILVIGWLSDFMNVSGSEDETMAQTINQGQNYLTADSISKASGFLLQQFLECVPRYLMAYSCYRFNKENRKAPANIMLFINILFYVVLFSSVFLFNMGYNVDTVFGRFIRFSIIPLFIVMTYFYQNRIYPRLTKNAIYIATFSTIYTLVYQLYNVM